MTSETISSENPRFAKNAAVDKVIIFSIVTTPIFVQCAKATPCNNRPSLLLLYCLFFRHSNIFLRSAASRSNFFRSLIKIRV